ncbi:MAG: hypothetical protein WDO24_29930 [Pseudomonadota bacterium]
MQIGDEGLAGAALADIAAPEQNRCARGEMVAPAGDLAGIGRERGVVDGAAAELDLARLAIGQEMNRLDARIILQRRGDLGDAVLVRIEDDDLDVAVGAAGQGLPIGDPGVDEQELMDRAVGRRRRGGSGRGLLGRSCRRGCVAYGGGRRRLMVRLMGVGPVMGIGVVPGMGGGSVGCGRRCHRTESGAREEFPYRAVSGSDAAKNYVLGTIRYRIKIM